LRLRQAAEHLAGPLPPRFSHSCTLLFAILARISYRSSHEESQRRLVPAAVSTDEARRDMRDSSRYEVDIRSQCELCRQITGRLTATLALCPELIAILWRKHISQRAFQQWWQPILGQRAGSEALDMCQKHICYYTFLDRHWYKIVEMTDFYMIF
jgi:hypothetical protein